MSFLEIFDVAHGQCSLLTSNAGAHLLIDCGHNVATGWRPSDMLWQRSIGYVDEMIITNCDEDHVSDLPAVLDTVGVGILNRNPTVGGADLYRLKAQGGMGRGIAALAKMIQGYGDPVSHWPDYDGMTYRQFWNRYPSDFEDENNLSLVTVLRWPGRNGEAGFSIITQVTWSGRAGLHCCNGATFVPKCEISAYLSLHITVGLTVTAPNSSTGQGCNRSFSLYQMAAFNMRRRRQFHFIVDTRRGWSTRERFGA
ncbi:MAG: hypothetical protein HC869_11745 [Rhodospirillales bacterium]|nr:hypothetical protein [Rhodospirillales bacterium]